MAEPGDLSTSASPPLAEPAPVTLPPVSSGASPWSRWPWLVAAALAGLALAYWLNQQKRRRTIAEALAFEAPTPPAPSPQPAPSAPPLPTGLVTTRLRSAAAPQRTAPQAAATPTGAVVSTRLRPWIDLELVLTGIQLNDQEAVLSFRILIANSGTASARDIVVEALALNAGEQQSEELATFYARPPAGAAAVDSLPRLGTIELSHQVRMPRGAIREYASGDRKLFVPILAFNVSYGWPSGSGRTSAAFLVGRVQQGSDRLAPLRADGPAPPPMALGARLLDDRQRR